MACAPNVAHQFNLACLQPPKDGGLSINTIKSNGNGNGNGGNTDNHGSSTTHVSISNGHVSIDLSCNGLHKDKDVHVNGGHKEKEVGTNAHVELLNMDKDVITNGHVSNGGVAVNQKDVITNGHVSNGGVAVNQKDVITNGHVSNGGVVVNQKDVITNGHVSNGGVVSTNGHFHGGHKEKELGTNAHFEFVKMEKDVSTNGHVVNGIVEKDASSNGHVNGGYKEREVGINTHVDVVKKEKDVSSNGHLVKQEKDVRSKVLVIGATGFIGRFVAEASAKSGRTTYALVRPATSKQKLVQELSDSGVHILHGCVGDYNSLVKAIRQVDVVICTIGGPQILSQLRIIDAIKEVGASVKRFLPSEFGHDVDHADPEEPALAFYKEKRRIRRAVEEAMIPYTYICCNSIAGWPYYYHTHPTEIPPPSDRFEIYGDGNVKAYFVSGEDIGAYTMQAVDDPRTLNKSLHFRPPQNFLTLNEMATIWETKIQKTLPRVVITEEDLLVIAKENIMPLSIVAALTHDIFINGCQFKFALQEPHDVEACELYPDIKYTTIEDFFNQYL